MTVAWVIGSGGLLGSALCRALHARGTDLFFPSERFCWGDPQILASQFASAVEAFGMRPRTGDLWEIYWAAGVGTMSSQAAELKTETEALVTLLRLVEAQPQLARGNIILASSAGAIYAGSKDEVITEHSAPAPTTAYAQEKLIQEALIRSFAEANPDMTALIARISTLYGPGHSAGKKQGLLTHIARCILRNQPIQIYVPFDTIRDYITAKDAAAAMVAISRAMVGLSGTLIKIIASQEATTIAEIISIFKRLARRPPRIITSASRLSSLYSRRVEFKSVIPPHNSNIQKTSLLVGISQVFAAERKIYVQSPRNQ